MDVARSAEGEEARKDEIREIEEMVHYTGRRQSNGDLIPFTYTMLYLSIRKFCFERFDDLFVQTMDDLFGIRIAQVEDDMGNASFDIGTNGVTACGDIVIVDSRLDRTLDGCGIAPDCGAVLIEHFIFMAECFDIAADKVPDTGVLCDDAQCQLFATSADDEGWIGLLHWLGLA